MINTKIRDYLRGGEIFYGNDFGLEFEIGRTRERKKK